MKELNFEIKMLNERVKDLEGENKMLRRHLKQNQALFKREYKKVYRYMKKLHTIIENNSKK